MATNYYDSFVKKLKEIFMMDHAELDFGIYRIMNQKRQDIMHFLEHELLPQVKEVLNGAGAGDTASIKAQMKEIEQQAASFGASADNNPVYQQLKAKLEASGDTAALQNEVFSHLVTFFTRYYDNGDFVSKRRYKDNTYAIPYNGEEVKLHWANADQYYIKSSEYFRDYTFVLPESRRKVHFVLKDASTEQNNNKAANNMERRFALYDPEGEPCFEVVGDDLSIFFTYELMPKATKQKDLLADALGKIMEIVPDAFNELLTVKSPTKDNANRTLLEKHLTDYTAKNSFDYFIHKDLGGFLRRELDFYIKNEVMLLDDLDVQHIQSQLSIVKAIKQVGDKIIRMLAQLENFQKRLWLKKKFVVQSDYCITIDRVPEELYDDIIANDRQREEWVRLFAIDEIQSDAFSAAYSIPLTMDFLKQNPFLVLDTAFFPAQFKHKLLSHLGDKSIDEQCNGTLIHSDNFHAINILQCKYANRIKCIYIDPPYNTDASKIAYKNGYEHSSWLSLMESRLSQARKLMNSKSVIELAIDDYELRYINCVMESVFGIENFISNIAIYTNPKGRDQGFIAQAHDYSVVYAKDKTHAETCDFVLSQEEMLKKFSKTKNGEAVRELPLKRTGTEKRREDRPYMFFPFFFDTTNNKLLLPTEEEIKGIYNEETKSFDDNYLFLLIKKYESEGKLGILPQGETGEYLRWRWGFKSCSKGIESGTLFCKKTRSGHTVYQYDLGDEFAAPKSMWITDRYDASSKGTNILNDIVPNSGFDYPKSVYTVEDNIFIGSTKDDIVLDFFAGSATTAHAIHNLYRKEEKCRKFILCDMANYFNTVTKVRTERIIYSPDWKDGKPVSRQGISQCFKYLRLEQYEDTLNNLELQANQQTEANFEDGSNFKESYMLGYMLDTETRDSLLNLKMFENPFAMTLKTTKDNELVETPVDMVETFNYLIGLNVDTEDWYRNDNICVVQGRTHRDNLRTLVIWRNCKEINNDELNKFFERMDFRTRDSEFDVIYVNGDNTLPNLRRDEDHWKVVLTEEEFAKRMFEND